MISTRVGYTGGTSADPTYTSIGDHSEAIEIVYDPDIISYSQLLDEFWTGHDPTRNIWSRQYRSYLFHGSDTQRKVAEKSLADTEKRVGRKIYTEIKPAPEFYQAENYHQKYYLQMQGILKDEFMNIYPRINDLVSSTAAARVNGFAGGYGSKGDLEKEKDKLGISSRGIEKLKTLVSRTYW